MFLIAKSVDQQFFTALII